MTADGGALTRAIAVNVNMQTKQIQLVIHERGHPIPGAAIVMTVEQAMAHRDGLTRAINMAQGRGQNLILPGDLVAGKPFLP
jgi:hypothetical protein